MATLRLNLLDRKSETFPNLCIRCGLPATRNLERTFYSGPWWLGLTAALGLVPFLIIVFVATRRERLVVPVCDRHRFHWLVRLVASIPIVCLVSVPLMYIPKFLDDFAWSFRAGRAFGDSLLFAAVLTAILLPLFGLYALLHLTKVRATEATEMSVTLKGVSQRFVRAFQGESADAITTADHSRPAK